MSAAIRLAVLSDAQGINNVYNPYIRESAATFETEEYEEGARKTWLGRLQDNPRCCVFVAENEMGEISGFANASPFDVRQGYDTSVKVSVFVAADQQGQKLGKRLYQALFETIERANVHRAYALIVPPNPASVALHEAFGFAHVSTLNEVGWKFDRFHDVMWFEKRF